MNKRDARNFVKSNIADAFIQGCKHHINNTTNNEYKKFLIDQIAALNKKLRDDGWTTFDVPAFTPSAPEGTRELTEEEKRIMQQIEKSTKILDDMAVINSEIHIMRKITWDTNLNSLSRAITALEAQHNFLLKHDPLTPSKEERRQKLEPLAANILSFVSEIKNEDTYKNLLLKLEQDVVEFRKIVEYLKVSGALGRFPRLVFLRNWEIFFFKNWDKKIIKLSEINARLRNTNVTPAKDNVIRVIKTMITQLEDEGNTVTNIQDLHKFFRNINYIDTEGNLNLRKLKKEMDPNKYDEIDLLQAKTFEIYQFEQAIIHIDEEFKPIRDDLKDTIEAVNKVLKTRLY